MIGVLVSGEGSNLQYHVIGWAAFKPTDYDFQGSSGWITGSFDRVTWEGIPSAGGLDTGPTIVSLVK